MRVIEAMAAEAAPSTPLANMAEAARFMAVCG
jgi:hypothetical protein